MSDACARLEARQEILDGMYWYCRAFDRLDKGVLEKVFHRGATLHYPFIEGPWPEVIEFLWPTFEAYDAHSLQMSQTRIDLGADLATATAECYVTASFWQAG